MNLTTNYSLKTIVNLYMQYQCSVKTFNKPTSERLISNFILLHSMAKIK